MRRAAVYGKGYPGAQSPASPARPYLQTLGQKDRSHSLGNAEKKTHVMGVGNNVGARIQVAAEQRIRALLEQGFLSNCDVKLLLRVEICGAQKAPVSTLTGSSGNYQHMLQTLTEKFLNKDPDCTSQQIQRQIDSFKGRAGAFEVSLVFIRKDMTAENVELYSKLATSKFPRLESILSLLSCLQSTDYIDSTGNVSENDPTAASLQEDPSQTLENTVPSFAVGSPIVRESLLSLSCGEVPSPLEPRRVFVDDRDASPPSVRCESLIAPASLLQAAVRRGRLHKNPLEQARQGLNIEAVYYAALLLKSQQQMEEELSRASCQEARAQARIQELAWYQQIYEKERQRERENDMLIHAERARQELARETLEWLVSNAQYQRDQQGERIAALEAELSTCKAEVHLERARTQEFSYVLKTEICLERARTRELSRILAHQQQEIATDSIEMERERALEEIDRQRARTHQHETEVPHAVLIQNSSLGTRQFETQIRLQHTATHCNTLQHTATHCNALQHTATYCNNILQRLNFKD